jgi:hypothetical protein
LSRGYHCPTALWGTPTGGARVLSVVSRAVAQPEGALTKVNANQTGSDQIGSSGLAGVSTKVLFGDPSNPGFYTIVLFAPAHTTIPAHSHRDDRMPAVVSGTWQFGYGDRFDEGALKNLPAGSGYPEPGRMIISHGAAPSPSWLKSPALVPRIRSTSIRRTRPKPRVGGASVVFKPLWLDELVKVASQLLGASDIASRSRSTSSSSTWALVSSPSIH